MADFWPDFCAFDNLRDAPILMMALKIIMGYNPDVCGEVRVI